MKAEFLTAKNCYLFLTAKNFACARIGARTVAREAVGEGVGSGFVWRVICGA